MSTSEPRHFERLLVGILVGGAGRRMGGQPKGLLWAPGGQERIVPRLLRLTKEALPAAGCVLLGKHAAYVDLDVVAIEDAAPGAGPLAGLVSLLRAARGRQCTDVILLAGDLPRVTSELIGRLAAFETESLAVAPRIDGRYEPLFARYSVHCLEPAEEWLLGSDRSLQALLRSVGTASFSLTDEDRALLVDWDEPADISD